MCQTFLSVIHRYQIARERIIITCVEHVLGALVYTTMPIISFIRSSSATTAQYLGTCWKLTSIEPFYRQGIPKSSTYLVSSPYFTSQVSAWCNITRWSLISNEEKKKFSKAENSEYALVTAVSMHLIAWPLCIFACSKQGHKSNTE